METKTYIDQSITFIWTYGPKVLTALALLVLGLWVIRRLTLAFRTFLDARHVDASLSPFFASLADIVLKASLLLVVASTVGIQTTSFIALFSAVAFSVGLALQGSLGNFASGVLILLFRPYRVGDLLTVHGKTGLVAEIQIFNTVLVTSGGRRIIVPNGKMTEGPIENIVAEAEVQAEVSLLIDLETDLGLLRSVAAGVAEKCPWALPGKPASVQIAGISRDDMKAQIAVVTYGRHYEETLFYLYESLKTAFEQAGIELAKERRKEEAV